MNHDDTGSVKPRADALRYLWALVKAAGIVGGLALVVLLVTLFIAIPSGSTRLHVSGAGIPMQLVERFFADAEAKTGAAFGAHEGLSEEFSGTIAGRLARPKFTEDQSTLRKIVTSLGLTLDHTEDTGAIEGTLDLVAFFEALYTALGFTDYYVTVTLLEEAPCPTPSEATDCWRINVRYAPSELQSETLVGSRQELASDLAVFIMRGVVQTQGDNWRADNKGNSTAVPPYILAANIPGSMEKLLATSEGLQILDEGCTNIGADNSRSACLAKAREKLLQAAGVSAGGPGGSSGAVNPAAAFGLAFLELQAAKQQALQGAPALVVEKKLWEMEKYLKKMRPSQFLMKIIASNGAPRFEYLLKNDDVDRDLLLGTKAANFSCALSQYRRANWQECLRNTEQLEVLPAPIRPYFEAARYDARLYESQGDRQAFLAVLAELWATIEAVEESNGANAHSWPLRLVALRRLCEHEKPDAETLRGLENKLMIRLEKKVGDSWPRRRSCTASIWKTPIAR